jgi:hypothetical protein
MYQHSGAVCCLHFPVTPKSVKYAEMGIREWKDRPGHVVDVACRWEYQQKTQQ